MVVFMLVVHWFACVLYGVSRWEELHSDGESWIRHQNITEANLDVQYMTAFYFAAVSITTVGIPSRHVGCVYT